MPAELWLSPLEKRHRTVTADPDWAESVVPAAFAGKPTAHPDPQLFPNTGVGKHLMKSQLLLPMLATLTLAVAANAQPPEPPRPQPEPRRDAPEARRPQPNALNPEARRAENRRFTPRNPQPPPPREFHRSPGEHRPEARGHHRGFRPVPPEIQELRDQVRRLTREVEELRRIVGARQDSRAYQGRSEHHHRPDFRPPQQRGGPGADAHHPRPQMPPMNAPHRGGPSREGDQRPHGDAGPNSRGTDRPHPPGPRPEDRHEPHGNPPPK